MARSNYEAVKSQGVKIIASPDRIKGGSGTIMFDWVYKALNPSPTATISIPETLKDSEDPFSYIFVCTKILSDPKLSLVECLEPYVTPKVSTIVLIQNGVGIEDEIQKRWPDNVVITGIVR